MRYVEELRALRRSPDIIVASLTANILGLVLPLVMIQLYDRVIPNQGYETLIVLGLGLGTAVLFDAILRVARGQIVSRAGAKFELFATTTALRNLLHAPDVRREAPPGVLFNELTRVDRIRMFHTGETGTALLDLPFVLVFLGVMIVISPVLGGTVLTLVALVFLLVRRVRRKITDLTADRLERDGRRQSFLIETLAGIEVIKALGAEDFMERRYERMMGGNAAISARLAAHVQRAQGIAGAAGLLAPVVTAAVGAYLAIEQQLTVGALAAAVLLTGRIVQPALKVEMLLAGEDDILSHEETVKTLLNEGVPSGNKASLTKVERLTIPKLSRPDSSSDEPSSPDDSLALVKGDWLAISVQDTRDSAAVLFALAGHHTNLNGTVLLNDVPIADYEKGELRSRVALVSGEHQPLSGTLLENLTRFQPELYRERALELCAKMGIDQYIAQHPEGLSHRLLGEVGGELPAAVSDAVSIISSLVTDPDIIIFDEVGTSLDPKMLKTLLEYLVEIRHNTIIVVASNRSDVFGMATRNASLESGHLRVSPKNSALNLGRVGRLIK